MCAVTAGLDEGHRDNVACEQRATTPRSLCSLSPCCLLALVHFAVNFVFAACATCRAVRFHWTVAATVGVRVTGPTCACSCLHVSVREATRSHVAGSRLSAFPVAPPSTRVLWWRCLSRCFRGSVKPSLPFSRTGPSASCLGGIG